jgi:hypothetical protein
MAFKRLICLICLACTSTAFGADEAEDDALNLADATPETVKPASSDLKVFTELSAGQVSLRQGSGGDISADAQRLSVDVLLDKKLAPDIRAVFSDRLDLTRQLGGYADQNETLNTFKEAYVSWQPQNNRVLELGRINARYGSALGYNPTDFFREGANRSIVSVDPNSIRENRMGTAMLRGQILWAGGALTALYAPKLADTPDNASWSTDFGSTNNRNRWLLAASHQFSEGLNPQLMLFGDEKQPVQLGFNLATVLNDATVTYLEWSGGRMKSQWAQAMPPEWGSVDDEAFRNRLATGFTYTNAKKMSLTLEYHYNGAGLDQAGWNALRAGSPMNYGLYRQLVQNRLELVTRQAAFLRATWQDAMINKLDLAAMVRYNLDDQSHLAWLEARYRLDHAEFTLQWQLNTGDAGTEYGAAPQRRNVQMQARYYFE